MCIVCSQCGNKESLLRCYLLYYPHHFVVIDLKSTATSSCLKKKLEKKLTLSELFPVTELHLGDLDSIHENAHLSKCHGNLHQIRIEVIIQGRAKGQNR